MVEFHLGDMITRSPFGSIAPFSLSPQELKHQMQTRIQFRRTDQGARKTLLVITEGAKTTVTDLNERDFGAFIDLLILVRG